MKFKELNSIAAVFIVDFALGIRTPDDIEAQQFYSFLQTEKSHKINRMLHHYGISEKLAKLDQNASNSSASVIQASNGYVEMNNGSVRTTFKIKPIDTYLEYFLGVDDRYLNYPLIKFLLTSSPYRELFVFSEGLDLLNQAQSANRD